MNEPVIDIRDLRVARGGRPVLHGISLGVPRGAITGLLGPSGCGKTTLMRAIVGVQRIASGDVRVLGEHAGSPSLRPRLGYVTQAPAVYEDLTVAQNLQYFGRVLGAAPARVEAVIATVGLQGAERQLAANLSGGQRARVSLATALLNQPDVLILDEPTVGLDPVLRESLWETFHALAADGATLLVSSHVMDEAERCDRLVLMREGRILAEDTPAGILARTGAADVEHAFLALVKGQPVAVAS